jgi:hypothetical protein
MYILFDLLVAYGIAFGLMNKIAFLHKKPFFKDLLKCSYCTGFHAGYLTFIITFPVHSYGSVLSGLSAAVAMAFGSSAFCYIADVATQYLELNVKE